MLLASPLPYVELSVGGGVESNVNHANTAAEEQAAGYGDLSALAGLSHADESDAPERPEVWLEMGYDLLWFPEITDLTSHALSLSVGGAFDPLRDVTLSAIPFVTGVVYDDSARNVVRTGGALGVRWRARRWLHTAVRLHPSVQLARDDVFSSTSLGGTATVKVLPADWVAALIGYSLSVSDVVLYTSTLSPGVESQPRRRGRPVATFGEEVLATKERATIHSLLASVTFTTAWGLYTIVGYTGSYVGSIGSQSYVDHVVALRVGYLWMDADE